ncbi:hypothetical protein G6725_02195 [Polynucleobacter paneuropaeus]|nr:hypothetical protein [Polynucleobacter paneuropaeus]
MSIDKYWPSTEEINNCIKDQAENSSDAVLLAVHQQFPLAYSTVGPDGNVMPESKKSASEDDFLRYFLSDAPSGSHVVPITGQSGVGKSHLVRILDARIKRLKNADKYLVIRIPKSASLRKVVDLILSAEPLQDKKYNSVKAEFSKAMADIRIEDAVITFQGQLEIALNEYSSTQKEAFKQSPTDGVVKRKIAHAESLPLLMSDAEIVQHFRLNVLPRIIQRSVNGGDLSKDDVDFDPNSIKFRVEDFDFEGLDIASAGQRVAKYYQLNFLGESTRERDLAVEVLNDVVDQATNQLYKLNQSLGGMTLGEVILEIRRLLLKDGRELVLLVEDFAALVGIQETLAKVLIQEGATSKGTEFATIRSAIAVTDGYLGGKNTLATRAGQEWVVESRLESEDETLARTKKLVASYLNAARIGEKGLKDYYNNLLKKDNHASFNTPIFYEDIGESISSIQAFGLIDEIPLFPFTDNSIEFLARQSSGLRSGNALIFNPRYIIKNIIRLVLERRSSFIEGQFPPPGMISRKPSADVQNWISSLDAAPDLKGRYERLVTVWGNDPKNRSEIPGNIKSDIFNVFSLKTPEFSNLPSPSVEPKKSGPEAKQSVIAPVVDSKLEAKIHDYEKTLEQWIVDKTILEQGISNTIRQKISSLLVKNIDWNAERTLEVEIKSTQISIHNAAGGLNAASKDLLIELVTDPTDSDGRLRVELLALLRSHEFTKLGIENYPNSEEDLARIANLIDRLMPQAIEIARATNKKHTNSVIQALNLNGRVLGFIENNPSPTYIDQTLFANVELKDPLPTYASEKFIEWLSFKEKVLSIRPILQRLLLDGNGCFQGTGKKCYGIDIVKILTDYPTEPVEDMYKDLLGLDADTKTVLQSLSNARVEARIKGVSVDAQKVADSIESEFGDAFDKNEITETLRRIANNLKEMGRFNAPSLGFTFNEFSSICDEFRDSTLKESLLTFTKFKSDELSGEKKISNFGRLQFAPFSICERFISHSLKLISAVENEVKILEQQYKGLNKAEKIDAINNAFKELDQNLKAIERDAAHGNA